MIHLEDNKITITIHTSVEAVEVWIDLYKELLDLLQTRDPELIDGNTYTNVYTLLKEMLPNLDSIDKNDNINKLFVSLSE